MVASFRIRFISTRMRPFLAQAIVKANRIAIGVAVGIGLSGGLVSCVSVIPVDEYTIARAAMDGAKESEAPRFAPALWYKAEQAYREGETFFRERSYNDALKRFSQARTLAEQAENAARLSRFESGDLAP